MKNIKKVEKELYRLFTEYQTGNIDDVLLSDSIINLCKGDGKKSYWWRFFNTDTGANDGYSVRASLNSYKNSLYLMDCIEIAIKEKSLIVLYS